MVKSQPLPGDWLPEGLPDISTGIEVGQLARHINGYLLKISMFGCDGSECIGDPINVLRFVVLKDYVFEFCSPQEVDQTRPRLNRRQKLVIDATGDGKWTYHPSYK